jgi:hypothetical protein
VVQGNDSSHSVPAHPRAALRRAAALLLLAAAAYVCWVLARQVLWGVQEREPFNFLSVGALVYLAAAVCTQVLAAVTLWWARHTGRLLWPWSLAFTAPGIAYLGRALKRNLVWGGPVGADFYFQLALFLTLVVLGCVALVFVWPRARRSWRRWRGIRGHAESTAERGTPVPYPGDSSLE